jgi:hypothetical protein
MTVEVLRLSGRPAAEAEQAAKTLIDMHTGPRDLRNLLVIDDTDLLVEHEQVYAALDKARRRVEKTLCVAMGPHAQNGRKLRLPGNLGGTQGSPVLWVSDPDGIDWRVATAATALGHLPGKTNGLDLLVELLSADDMFRRVYKTLVEQVPGRVASPGLRLAGQADEAATFVAALAVAVGVLCGPGPGADRPFRELLPAQAGGATLAEDGPLARYRDEVAAAAEAVGGLAGRLRRGQAELRAHLVEAGAALTDLRDLVARLLRDAQATGELTANQRRLISQAGLGFPPGSPLSSPARPAGSGGERSLVYQTVVSAIGGGDTLGLVARRLKLTGRELERRGSASYAQQVDQKCPPPLLDRLSSPPERLPRRGGAQARRDLGLDDAVRAARELEDLIVAVANREWSPVGPSSGEVARIRVALDGICKTLTEQADALGKGEGKARGGRLARLGEALMPVLSDLVFRVLQSESAQPSASGQEAFAAAQERASSLVTSWIAHVREHGVASPPPFATSSARHGAQYADEDDVAEIREALLYQPAGEMWQLCAPEDIDMLNVATAPQVVRFASRLDQGVLAGTLPGDQPVWTSTGSHAGLLRLVSLRPGSVWSSWGEPSTAAESL